MYPRVWMAKLSQAEIQRAAFVSRGPRPQCTLVQPE